MDTCTSPATNREASSLTLGSCQVHRPGTSHRHLSDRHHNPPGEGGHLHPAASSEQTGAAFRQGAAGMSPVSDTVPEFQCPHLQNGGALIEPTSQGSAHAWKRPHRAHAPGPCSQRDPMAVAEHRQHSLWRAGLRGAGLWPRCRLLAPFAPGSLHPLVPGLVQTAVGHPAQPWEGRRRLGHLPAADRPCFRRALPQASPSPQLTEQDPRTAAHAQACGC